MNTEELYANGFRGILYIMRGCPGSGKSRRALELVGLKENIFSADKWFSPNEDPEEYRSNWSKEKLFTAHSWCKSKLQEAMQRGITPIAVDNTNIKRRDFLPFVDMAKEYQYKYEICEPQSPWWKEIKNLLFTPEINNKKLSNWANKLANGFDYEGNKIKNLHGVPESVIFKMINSFQPYNEG